MSGQGGFAPIGNISNFGGFMNPMTADPAWAAAMQRQQYAASLLQQGSSIEPIRSPWQAAARAVQGTLGGYEMGQAFDAMQQYAAGSRQAVADAYANTPTPQLPPGTIQPQAGAPAPISGPGRQVTSQPLPPAGPPPGSGLDPSKPMSQKDQDLGRVSMRESGNQNIVSKIPPPPGYSADSVGTGYYQMIPSTWAAGAKLAGIQNPPYRAMDASAEDQYKAASALYDQSGLANWKQTPWTTGHYAGGPNAQWGGQGQPAGPPGQGDITIAATSTQPGATGIGGNQPGTTPGQNQVDAATAASQYGIQMAQEYRQRAINAAQSPYAAVRAMAPQFMQQSLQFAQYGRFVPGGVDQNGQQIIIDRLGLESPKTIGAPLQLVDTPQGGKATLGGQTVFPGNMQVLTSLGQIPWNQMTSQQQQQYSTAYHQVGAPEPEYNEKTGWTLVPSTKLPPNITIPPGEFGGAVRGTPPGTTPAPPGAGVTPPVAMTGAGAGQPVPSPQVVENQQQQITRDQAQTDALRAEGLEAQPVRQFTDQIRALMASGKVQTGALAPLGLEIGRLAQGLGFDPKLMDQVTKVDPATGELLTKLFTQFNTTAARTMGGTRTGSEVANLFMNNYPSIQSRPPTVDEFTRSIDFQNLFTQQRAQLANQWMDAHRGDAPGTYQSINSPAFNAWAKQQGLDPSVYASAALMASGQPQKVWANPLSRGTIGNAEADRAAHLAWGTYPGVGIMGQDGKLHYGPGQ